MSTPQAPQTPVTPRTPAGTPCADGKSCKVCPIKKVLSNKVFYLIAAVFLAVAILTIILLKKPVMIIGVEVAIVAAFAATVYFVLIKKKAKTE